MSNAIDLIVEGWTERLSASEAILELDCSPAPIKAHATWVGGGHGQGVWQAEGLTLNAAITSSATSLAVARVTGKPGLTTTSGPYPLTIQIDQEHLTISAAPGSATSPQTVTVTRAADGTAAAAHPAGAAVALVPVSTWIF